MITKIQSNGISIKGLYEGSFRMKCTQDRVEWTQKNLVSYVGPYKDCRKSGKGVETWVPGYMNRKYEGNYVKGRRTGFGKMLYGGGSIREGLWVNGQWVPNQMQATFVDKTGVKYVVDYKNGKKEGAALVTAPDGKKWFEGEMKNDDYWSGTGIERHSNSGDTYTGTWKNGKYFGKGKYEWANGDVFDGKCEGNGKCLGNIYKRGRN